MMTREKTVLALEAATRFPQLTAKTSLLSLPDVVRFTEMTVGLIHYQNVC